MLNLDSIKGEEGDFCLKLVETIAQILHDKSAKNIFVIDIKGVSTLCDYCIVCEGTVDRHVRSLAKTVEEQLAPMGHKPSKMEGLEDGQWAIIDYLNVMVHILTPSFRDKYHLERLWQEGRIIELNFEK